MRKKKAALFWSVLGASLAVLSSACHAIEPESLKTDQSFIGEIKGRLESDVGGDYAGITTVRFDVVTDWPQDLSMTLGSENDFARERATYFLNERLQELGIDQINIQPDFGTKFDVCTLLDVQISVTLRRVARPGTSEPLLVGSLNLGVARGHPRGTRNADWCKYEYEVTVGRIRESFFFPKNETREEIELALEPALLDGIDSVVLDLATSDSNTVQRILGWSEAQ